MIIKHEDTPKVSVCVVTYNQYKYIGNCLKSILDQETDFDYEVIVGDDCSTDGTRELIIDFSKRYPDRVIPVIQEYNVGPSLNYINVHSKSKGKYIACIDGDDQMLPTKLQKEVDVLDSDSSIAVVKHRMYHRRFDSDELFEDGIGPLIERRQRFTLQDVLSIGSIGTHSSKMYRMSLSRALNPLPSKFLDWITDVIDMKSGDMFIINELLGVRHVGIGISCDPSQMTREILKENIEYLINNKKSDLAALRALDIKMALGDIKRWNNINYRLIFKLSYLINPIIAYYLLRSLYFSRNLKKKMTA